VNDVEWKTKWCRRPDLNRHSSEPRGFCAATAFAALPRHIYGLDYSFTVAHSHGWAGSRNRPPADLFRNLSLANAPSAGPGSRGELLRLKQERKPRCGRARVRKTLADRPALLNYRPVQILLVGTPVTLWPTLNSNRKSIYRAYELNARIYILQVNRISKEIYLVRCT
jgi:hypothetical protein